MLEDVGIRYGSGGITNLVCFRVHFTLNATVLMHHALKISDEYSINHFTLANMYAALGQYNVSVHYYEETLKRQKDFETALKELAAVKCQLKLQVIGFIRLYCILGVK